MNLKNYFLLFIILFTQTVSFAQVDQLDQQERNQFYQVALNAEFGKTIKGITKWNEDLRVFIKNPKEYQLVNEFDIIAKEINDISSTIKIKRVIYENEANFVIFFSSKDVYAKYEPTAKDYIEDNYGLFFVYDFENIIYKGSMYVDVYRTEAIECQKHLLREELTQALGLMNDHNGSVDSIFYQGWGCKPSYTLSDLKMIKLFLSNNIKAGMNKIEIEEYLNSLM